MYGYNDYNLLCRYVIFTIIIRNCVVPGAALVEGYLLELVQTGCLSSSCPVSGSGLNNYLTQAGSRGTLQNWHSVDNSSMGINRLNRTTISLQWKP